MGGEKRLVTVIFADLRGFANFAEKQPAEDVVNILNQFFRKMTQALFHYKGTFDKFIGDAIMAYFGAPMSYPDDVLRSIKAAKDMQKSFAALRESWIAAGFTDLGLGIGLSTGEVIFGNVGAKNVMNYTIIGDTVNVAQRLEQLALTGQILLSDSTYQMVKDQVIVSKLPPQNLKGKQAPLIPYLLEGIKE